MAPVTRNRCASKPTACQQIRKNVMVVLSLRHNKACMFCRRKEINEKLYGPLYQLDDVVVHYFCLLLSSRAVQNGTDNQGIWGFLLKDIKAELARGTKEICCYCNKQGATISCYEVKCRKEFHLPCGLKNGSMHQYFGSFKSFCQKHRIPQIVDSSELKKSTSTQCAICKDAVKPSPISTTSIWAPCCKHDAWFHRCCIQDLALSAGYFFKCPLCNDVQKFKSRMLTLGIYIPSRDASWETVPNAFAELSERPIICSVEKCQCPHEEARNYQLPSGSWKILLCSSCGSNGTHKLCSSIKSEEEWLCGLCKGVTDQGSDEDLDNLKKIKLELLEISDQDSDEDADSNKNIKLELLDNGNCSGSSLSMSEIPSRDRRSGIAHINRSSINNEPILISDSNDSYHSVQHMPSTSFTTSKSLVVSTKKDTASPKNVTASPMNVAATRKNVDASRRTVPAENYLNPINIGTTITTIDLTEDDDEIEESEIIILEDSSSPIKMHMPSTSVTTSKSLVVSTKKDTASPMNVAATRKNVDASRRTVPAENYLNPINIGTTITTIDLTEDDDEIEESEIIILEDSSSPIKMRNPQRTIFSNEDTINTSQNPISTDVSQTSGTVQPMSKGYTSAYTPGQITVPQYSISLKTLTLSCTRRQLPAVSPVSGSMPAGFTLPHATPGTSFATSQIPQTGFQSTRKSPPPAIPFSERPSPVPGIPKQISLSTKRKLPPAPILVVYTSKPHNMSETIGLAWTMELDQSYAEILKYEIYAYQPAIINRWKKIGNVNALTLPMDCTLSYVPNGQKYCFKIRAVDVNNRAGPFSIPKSMQ